MESKAIELLIACIFGICFKPNAIIPELSVSSLFFLPLHQFQQPQKELFSKKIKFRERERKKAEKSFLIFWLKIVQAATFFSFPPMSQENQG